MLKDDGCDINKGLKETAKLQWSGNVDLCDEAVQKQFQSYKLRLQKADKPSASRESVAEDLRAVLSDLNEDLAYIREST